MGKFFILVPFKTHYLGKRPNEGYAYLSILLN